MLYYCPELLSLFTIILSRTIITMLYNCPELLSLCTIIKSRTIITMLYNCPELLSLFTIILSRTIITMLYYCPELLSLFTIIKSRTILSLCSNLRPNIVLLEYTVLSLALYSNSAENLCDCFIYKTAENYLLCYKTAETVTRTLKLYY